MKKILAMLVVFVALMTLPCFGQETGSTSVVLNTEAQNFVLDLLTVLIVKYPWIATVVAIMGSMRLWAKPLFSVIHSIIQVTPSKWDDGIWAAGYRFFTETKTGKLLTYLLDWFASIKIQPTVPVKPDVNL